MNYMYVIVSKFDKKIIIKSPIVDLMQIIGLTDRPIRVWVVILFIFDLIIIYWCYRLFFIRFNDSESKNVIFKIILDNFLMLQLNKK